MLALRNRSKSRLLPANLLFVSCAATQSPDGNLPIMGEASSCAEAVAKHREEVLSSICVRDTGPGELWIVSGAMCGTAASAGAEMLLDALTSFPRFYNGTLDLVDDWVESANDPSLLLREHFSASPVVNAILDILPRSNTAPECAPNGAGYTEVSGSVAVSYVALHVWPTRVGDAGGFAVYVCGGTNGVEEQAMVAPDPTLVRLGFLAAFLGEPFRELSMELSEVGPAQGSSKAESLAGLPARERLRELERVILNCASCLDQICATAERFSWFLGVRVSDCDDAGRWSPQVAMTATYSPIESTQSLVTDAGRPESVDCESGNRPGASFLVNRHERVPLGIETGQERAEHGHER